MIGNNFLNVILLLFFFLAGQNMQDTWGQLSYEFYYFFTSYRFNYWWEKVRKPCRHTEDNLPFASLHVSTVSLWALSILYMHGCLQFVTRCQFLSLSSTSGKDKSSVMTSVDAEKVQSMETCLFCQSRRGHVDLLQLKMICQHEHISKVPTVSWGGFLWMKQVPVPTESLTGTVLGEMKWVSPPEFNKLHQIPHTHGNQFPKNACFFSSRSKNESLGKWGKLWGTKISQC